MMKIMYQDPHTVYVFDIDGVLLDVSERLKLALQSNDFWRTFFRKDLLHLDKPRAKGIDILRDRAQRGLIAIVTGRPEFLRKATIQQLRDLGVYDLVWRIYMRKRRDFRKTKIIKAEIVRQLIIEGFEIVEIHDDEIEVLSYVGKICPGAGLYLHRGNDVEVLRSYRKIRI